MMTKAVFHLGETTFSYTVVEFIFLLWEEENSPAIKAEKDDVSFSSSASLLKQKQCI